MTYEQLKYFIAVCDSGSINQAAKTIFISPQGVSSGIRKLESELGAQLFLRTPSGLVQTNLSKTLLPIAREAVGLTERLKAIASGHSQECMLIRFGALGHNSITDRIGEAASQLCQLNSNYKFEMVVLESTQYELLLEMLDNSEVDIIYMFHTEHNPKYDYYTFNNGILKCGFSPQNPLSSKSCLTWTDLVDQNLIFPEKDGLYTHLIELQCRRFGFSPRAKYYSLDSNYIAKLISRNSAAGFFFWDYIDRVYESYNDIICQDVYPLLEVSTSLITRSENSSAFIRSAALYIQKALKALY